MRVARWESTLFQRQLCAITQTTVHSLFPNDKQKIMSATKPQICICLCGQYMGLIYAHIEMSRKLFSFSHIYIDIDRPRNPSPHYNIIWNADCVPDLGINRFQLILVVRSNLTLFYNGYHLTWGGWPLLLPCSRLVFEI